MCVSGFSLIPKEYITKLIVECPATNLEVLQLAIYGRAFLRSFVKVTYARHFVGFPCLTFISLKGAFLQSYVGLSSFVLMDSLLSFVYFS